MPPYQKTILTRLAAVGLCLFSLAPLLAEKEELPNGGFEDCNVPEGTTALRPADSGWSFSGNAGICDVRVARQPAVAVPSLPAAAKPLAQEQWAGFKFTVGEKDLYVYQLGRWVTQGNKDAHELCLFRL